MKLKAYQWGELIGIFFLLASTGTQIFYVEPLRRDIEWRLAAFTVQQNGQLQATTVYDTHIATLKALNAPQDQIAHAETERRAVIEKYKTADANVADYLLAKEPVENLLDYLVVGLFAIGSILAGYGRAMEMIAGRRLG